MFDVKFFAATIRVKRAERGWSQEQLAEACGLSKNSIARYENGTNEPMFTAVCSLADAFQCPISDFVKSN